MGRQMSNVYWDCLLFEMFCLLGQHTLICDERQFIYPSPARVASDLCDVLSSEKCEFDACVGLGSVIDD